MKHFILIVLFIWSAWTLNAQIIDHWETLIFSNDTWKYSTSNTDPGSTWNQLSFNDSEWPSATGGFGYEDDDDNTIIESSNAVFIRKTFNIIDISIIELGLLHMDYDDGFVAYINGVEIARSGIGTVGTPPSYNQLADINHEAIMYSGGKPEEFVIQKADLASILTNGNNVLAIEVHNVTAASSDMSAIAFLSIAINDNSFTYHETPSWFTKPFIFTSSNLPIVIIKTENNAPIVDEPKTKANMRIIDNGSYNYITDVPNIYNGNIGIEIRGSSSAGYPQKSYAIETRDSMEVNLNVQLLGMPKENDWVMLTNYNDKSFIRNALSYHLFNEMGYYAARIRHCETVINGAYSGLYLFGEKLKQDNDRIDIAKLDADDNAGDSLTGGYVFKIDNYDGDDYWTSNYHPIDRPSATARFVYHDPKSDELTPEQKNYIQSYVDTFETILYSDQYNDPIEGYMNFIDVSSFLDYFIISELSRNVDGYKKSRYFHKEKDSKGGLISSGPVWDFDWAYKNIEDCSIFRNFDGSGWAYKINEFCGVYPSPSGWMVRLMQDDNFQNRLGNRYHELRQSLLSNDYIHHFIDSISTLCNEAQERHYSKYQTLGKNIGAPELDAIPTTFEGEVTKLRSWIDLRLSWLDNNMPEATVDIDPSVKINSTIINVYPNPAQMFTTVESNQVIETICIYSYSGNLVQSNAVYGQIFTADLSKLDAGIYLIRATFTKGEECHKKLIIK